MSNHFGDSFGFLSLREILLKLKEEIGSSGKAIGFCGSFMRSKV
jgi:hypothetical protein